MPDQITVVASPKDFLIVDGGTQDLTFSIPIGLALSGTWSADSPPSPVAWRFTGSQCIDSFLTLTLGGASHTYGGHEVSGALTAAHIAAINAAAGGILHGSLAVSLNNPGFCNFLNPDTILQLVLDWTQGGGGGPGSGHEGADVGAPIRDTRNPDEGQFSYQDIQPPSIPTDGGAGAIKDYMARKLRRRLPIPEQPAALPSVPQGEVSDATIITRDSIGKAHMARFSAVDKASCENFRDATGQSSLNTEHADPDTNVLENQPVGVTNQFLINALTLSAATCINEPDFFVRADAPNATDLVRKDVARQWTEKNWARKSRACFNKYCIGGLGIMAYRWDKEQGTVFEPVNSWDLIIDPHVTDWNEVSWGGRVINKSLRDAIKMYDPEGKKGYFKDKLGPMEEEQAEKSPEDTGSMDRITVTLHLYWDKKTEAVIYNKKVIHRDKNRYERVPLWFLEGEIDPGPTNFPIGLGVLASGPQKQITELDSTISNIAKHGGPINVIDQTLLTKTVEEAWTSGQQQGLIPVKGMPERAFMRVKGEELPQAVLVARQEAHRNMHGIMGTNDTMMGQYAQGDPSATESALISRNSGARQVQARKEYEAFLDRLADTVVKCEAEFGGAVMRSGRVSITDDERGLHKAYKSVRQIYVIDSSTTYRDPAQDQQQCMQVLKLQEEIAPMLLQLGVPGPMVLVLLLKSTVDTLRAFGRTNVDEYLPGVNQFIGLLAQTYVPGLMQGQLPPPPDNGDMKPVTVTAAIDKMPPEAQQSLLERMGLIQQGQQITPVSPTDGQDNGQGAEVAAQAEVQSAQLKAQDAERGRIADLTKQEAQHRHEAALQDHKQAHEERMTQLEGRHKLLQIAATPRPEPAKNGTGGKSGAGAKK